MPLYIGDYLADTAHLCAAEHGAYLLLLCHYWRTGEALPDDDAALTRISRMTRAEWKSSKETIKAFFKPAIINTLAVLTHVRVERELVIAGTRYASRKAVSDIANAARQAKREALLQGDHDSNLNRKLDASQPQPQPQSDKSEKDISSGKPDKKSISNRKLLNGHLKDFEAFWLVFPKKVAKGDAMKAYAAALKIADPSVILEGAQHYARNRKDEDSEFTKGPAGWLRGLRWLDEAPITEANQPDPDLERIRKIEAELMK